MHGIITAAINFGGLFNFMLFEILNYSMLGYSWYGVSEINLGSMHCICISYMICPYILGAFSSFIL